MLILSVLILFELAINLIQSKDNCIFVFAVSAPTIYEDEYMYFYEAFFDLNHSDSQNHNSTKEYKTILMIVPIGVLVVVDFSFGSAPPPLTDPIFFIYRVLKYLHFTFLQFYIFTLYVCMY